MTAAPAPAREPRPWARRGLRPVHALRAACLLVIAPALVMALPGSPYAFNLLKWVAVLVCAGLLGALLVVTRPAPRGLLARTPVVVVGGFLGWLALSTLLSPDPARSLTGVPIVMHGFLAFAASGVAFLGGRRLAWAAPGLGALATAATLVAAVIVGYGLLQQAGLDPLWRGVLDKGRIFATWGQANAYAAGLVLVLPLVAARAACASGWARWAGVLLVAAGLLTLAWSGSRGGWLGIVVAAGIAGGALLLRARLRGAVGLPRPAARTLLALGALSVAVALVAGPALVARVTVRERAVVGSVAMHLDLWAIGLRMAQEHPLTGIGLERYAALHRATLGPTVLSSDRTMAVLARDPLAVGPVVTSDPPVPYRDARQLARRAPASPHSVPVAIAAGAGFPALVLYVALFTIVLAAGVARVVRGGRRDAFLAAGALAAVAGHLVTDLFVAGEPSTGALAWLLGGALAAQGVGAGWARRVRRPRR